MIAMFGTKHTAKHVETEFVLPFQGEMLQNLITQGDALRLCRGALPWAGMFWAFQAKLRAPIARPSVSLF
jgi:hypothetical protein